MKQLAFFFSVFCGWLLPQLGAAQQVYQFSNYQANRYILNPAASGLNKHTEVTSGYRKMWSGIEGAPLTYYTSANFSLNKEKTRTFRSRASKKIYYKHHKAQLHHGLGVLVAQDEFGAFRKTRAHVSYAVHVPLSGAFKISFSPRFGWSGTRLNEDQVDLKVQGDPTYNHFVAENTSFNNFDMDAGLWLYSDDLFFGYSLLQLVPTQYTPADVDLDGKLIMHHNVMGGYHFALRTGTKIGSNQKEPILFTPSFLMRFRQNVPFNIDASLEIDYRKQLKVGGTWRRNNALAFWIGIYAGEAIELYYAFDRPTTKLKDYQTGTHEITLRLKLLREN